MAEAPDSNISFINEDSSSSNESSGGSEDEFDVPRGGVLPYRFEPLESSTDSHNENEELEPALSQQIPQGRQGNTNWCRCENCVVMTSELESRCCRESEQVCHLINNRTCVTNNDWFTDGCLNINALEIAYLFYARRRRQIQNSQEQGDIHKKYRYVAYRQFVMKVYHRLGQEVRKVLPSCVVHKIKEHFPSEEYTGFRYPRF